MKNRPIRLELFRCSTCELHILSAYYCYLIWATANSIACVKSNQVVPGLSKGVSSGHFGYILQGSLRSKFPVKADLVAHRGKALYRERNLHSSFL